MARTKIDYVKAYREMRAQKEELATGYNNLLNENRALRDMYDKAVEKGKANVELLYEQRGVIGFLETKILKLTEMMEEKHGRN